MSTKTFLLIFLGFALFILGAGSVFEIQEGQRGLMLKLGELVTAPNSDTPIEYGPGIHIKFPFITTVKKLDVRLQTLDVDSSRILTAEQKYVLVDYFAKWRIQDIPLFYKRTGGYVYRAQNLLRQKINDALRAAFGKRTIKDVVSGERSNIMSLLKTRANQSAKDLGMTVDDVRIKGIDLPKEVRESVFERMRTEREQVATKHRSQGKAEAEAIRANADASVAVTIAKAKTKAESIRAQGDRTAANLYAKAYSKSPEFYGLYRSLIAYQDVFVHHRALMVLDPNSEFFHYFKQSKSR